MRIFKRVLAVLGVLGIAAGCTSMQAPELNLTDLQFGEMRAFETELRVGIRIQNENPKPLRLEGAAYRVYVNGVYLGKGMSSESLTVPPLGSAVHTATLQISNLSLLPKIQRLLQTEGFSYRIEGRLYRPGFFNSIEVEESGQFSFDDYDRPRKPLQLQ